jgi:thiamine biosynthesis lipoprotein
MKKFLFNLPLLLLLTLTACDKQPELQKISGFTQGTTYHISYWQQPPTDINTIKHAINAELARIDKQLSNYRKDSVIEQFNALETTEPQAVGDEIVKLIEIARKVSVASDGCYDLSIKPLFDLWGFNKDKLTPPDNNTLQNTLKQVGFNQLEAVDNSHLRKKIPTLKIDLSSIAQGYSVEKIAGLLEEQGIKNYLVEIGGELQTRGNKPDGTAWRVAVEKPISSERTMHKVVTINGSEPLAVMTAGTYRHYFDLNGKRYSHILDAKKGIPVDHTTVSVTVIHNNPTEADAWDTALLCMGRQAGMEVANKAGISVLFIEQQGKEFKEYPSIPLTNLKRITIE